jgi:hypothetical protein
MLLFQQNTGICMMLGQKRGLYAPLTKPKKISHLNQSLLCVLLCGVFQNCTRKDIINHVTMVAANRVTARAVSRDKRQEDGVCSRPTLHNEATLRLHIAQ